MGSELEIRQLNEEELEMVVRIQEAITQKPVSREWRNLLKLNFSKPEGIDLVAVRDGEVVGYMHAQVRRGDFGLEKSGWIEMFGVAPKVMGEGVGRALADASMKELEKRGIKDIYTAVRWDSGDILAFFKKIGFNLSDFINLKIHLE